MLFRNELAAWCGVWLVLCALFVGGPAWPQAPAASREYQIKAAFLYNFTRFIDWPESAFASPDAPFVVCVLGEDPFGAALDEVVAGETVKGRPMQVQRHSKAAETQACQIVYVGPAEIPRLGAAGATLGERPVLTVGETEEFTRRGGMIRFDTIGGKIRLSINLDASKRAGLTLSSKLLRPAQIVASG